MRKFYFFLSLFFAALITTGTAAAQDAGDDAADDFVYLYNVGRGTFLQIGGTEVGSTFNLVATTEGEATKWELVDAGEEGKVLVKNVSTGLYLGACVKSTSVEAVAEADAVPYEHSVLANGNDVFRDTTNEDLTFSYLHVNGTLLGWETAGTATQWLVLKPSQLPVLEANLAATEALNNALTAGQELYLRTQPSDRALVTSVDQLATNAQEPLEGPIAGLIDGDASTFFHSNYSGESPDVHNLEVKLPGNELTEFVIKYVARSNGFDRPTIINVYGGTTADGVTTYGDEPFVQLTTADGIGQASGQAKLSTGDNVYDAFRFDVLQTNTSGRKFFTYAEFNLYEAGGVPAELDVDETLSAALATAIANGQAANLRDSDYAQLTAAVESASAAVRSVASVERKDLVAAIEAARTKLAEVTAQTNTPGYAGDEAKAAYEAAIATAQAVADDATKSAEECVAAQTALEAAFAAAATSAVLYPVDGYFTINNVNSSRGAVVYDPAHAESVDDTSGNSEFLWYAAAPDATDPNHLWGFCVNADNNEVYLYNVGKRLFASSAGKGSYGDTWIFSETPCPITMEGMTFPDLRIMGNGKTMSVSRNYTGPIITYYAAGDGGVPFRFTRVEKEVDPEVTAAIEALLEAAAEPAYDELVSLIAELSNTIAEAELTSDQIGYHTLAAITALQTAVDNAQDVVDAIVDDYRPAAAALSTLKAARAAYVASEVNLPEDGETYTIKSDSRGTNFYIVVNGEGALKTDESYVSGENGQWLCAVAGDGTFSFYNTDAEVYLGFKTVAATAYAWTLSGVQQNNPGCITMQGTYSDGRFLYLLIPNAGGFDQAGATFDKDATNHSSDFIFEKVKQPTGISNLDAAAENGAIYNVAGQRVDKNVESLERGLYIINGKKVLVK